MRAYLIGLMLFLLVVPMGAAKLVAAPNQQQVQSTAHPAMVAMKVSTAKQSRHSLAPSKGPSQLSDLCADCPDSSCDPDPSKDCSLHACCFLHPVAMIFFGHPQPDATSIATRSLAAIILPPPDQPPIA